jgi:hypothetical protein
MLTSISLGREHICFQILQQGEENRDINFDFVTTLGDRLDALLSARPRYAECDDNIHSVWSPGLNLFERLGDEVFEIDASPSSEDAQKQTAAKARETQRAGEKNSLHAPTKSIVENQRQVELSEALRWTVSVITSR